MKITSIKTAATVGHGMHLWVKVETDAGIIVKHGVDRGSYNPMMVNLDYLCQRYEGVTLEKFLKQKYIAPKKAFDDWIVR